MCEINLSNCASCRFDTVLLSGYGSDTTLAKVAMQPKLVAMQKLYKVGNKGGFGALTGC